MNSLKWTKVGNHMHSADLGETLMLVIVRHRDSGHWLPEVCLQRTGGVVVRGDGCANEDEARMRALALAHKLATEIVCFSWDGAKP